MVDGRAKSINIQVGSSKMAKNDTKHMKKRRERKRNRKGEAKDQFESRGQRFNVKGSVDRGMKEKGQVEESLITNKAGAFPQVNSRETMQIIRKADNVLIRSAPSPMHLSSSTSSSFSSFSLYPILSSSSSYISPSLISFLVLLSFSQALHSSSAL